MTTDHGGQLLQVLLVEDSPSDTALFEARLTESGIAEVHCVADLQSALSSLQSGSFDCALVDLHLPDARGLQAIGTIVTSAPTVAVIALTRFDLDDLGRQAMRLGAQDYLGKDHATVNRIRQAVLFAVERHALRLHGDSGQTGLTVQVLVEELADQIARARTLPVEDLRLPLEMVANLAQQALEELQATHRPLLARRAAVRSGQTAQLGRLFTNAAVLLEPMIDERRVTVDVGDMPDVVADPEGLLEVLLHLLRHAVRRSAAGATIRNSAVRQGLSCVVEISTDEPTEDDRPPMLQDAGAGANLEFCEHMVVGWGGELWSRTGDDGSTSLMFRLPHAIT